MIRYKIINIYFFLFFNVCFSQIDESNQISINGDNVFPFLFNSSNTTYNLGYRKTVNERKSYRIGLRYLFKDEDEFVIGIKPGMDWLYKKTNKWNFYYGIDSPILYRNDMSSSKKSYEFSILPFFGIQFKISNSFSVSLEPSLYLKYEKFKDYSDNLVLDNNSLISSGISELGIVYLNFHF